MIRQQHSGGSNASLGEICLAHKPCRAPAPCPHMGATLSSCGLMSMIGGGGGTVIAPFSLFPSLPVAAVVAALRPRCCSRGSSAGRRAAAAAAARHWVG